MQLRAVDYALDGAHQSQITATARQSNLASHLDYQAALAAAYLDHTVLQVGASGSYAMDSFVSAESMGDKAVRAFEEAQVCED